MSKSAVGLLEKPSAADQVVHDLFASAFPGNESRTVREPLDMAVNGVVSFLHTDFEVGLEQELKAIGATLREENAYALVVRRGVPGFATGSNAEVDNAGQIMNRHGAIEIEELTGGEPNDADMIGENVPPASDSSSQAGRIRESGGGSRLFVW